MIKIKGCTAIGNAGSGFYLRGEAEVDDCLAAENGGRGFDVADQNLLQRLGLPADTNPKILLDWLGALERTSCQEEEEITRAESSWKAFWDKLGNLAPPLSIASSLVSIANSPSLPAIMEHIRRMI